MHTLTAWKLVSCEKRRDDRVCRTTRRLASKSSKRSLDKSRNSSPWLEAVLERSPRCWRREACPTSRRKKRHLMESRSVTERTWTLDYGFLDQKNCELCFELSIVYIARWPHCPSHLCQPSPCKRKWLNTTQREIPESNTAFFKKWQKMVSWISTPVLSFNCFLTL